MRETVTAAQAEESGSVRFLYGTRFGGLILKVAASKAIFKIAGCFLNSALSRPLIRRYIKKHSVDMGLYIPEKYRCFNDFFTRRIRPELRPFASAPQEFPSPCDGKLSAYTISDGCTFDVKGFTYTVESLLKNKALSGRYAGGTCIVIRLCVDDYHRYFYVDGGRKSINVSIRGKLHTVRPYALGKRRVFAENSREYTVINTDNFGMVTQTEVGAMMVGRIENYHGEGCVKRGEEKGRFLFGGSTIVLFTEKDAVAFDGEFFANTADGRETVVRCGECIGKKVQQ